MCPQAASKIRPRSAGSPVEELRGVNDGNTRPGELHDAADVARRDERRTGAADVRELALAQLRGELRLQDVVGAGRAAAKMSLGYLAHIETGALEQSAWNRIEALAVLHRARGVIGD